MKLKSFYKVKNTIKKTKQQYTEEEKNFTNVTPGRGLICKTYKKFKNIHSIKPSNNILKWGTVLNKKILDRGISESREAVKEIINTLRHHRNSNQNDSEILSYTYQNG